uniref:Capsid n=1 Tax=Astrovirus swine/PoAstV14-4/Canada/2006 TaxID=942172 RepID=E7CVF4_9VIRU|nr:capsid [Astrovirus swine/PoAstV14-4/Canada/2006]
MANRQQKRVPRTTTNIVVRNGSAAPQARAPGAATGNRRRRNRRRPQQTVVRVLPNKNQGRRRNPRGQGFGNRVVAQKIVSTLGTVGSNGTGNIETELAVLLNPSTMKETTGSNTFGPVQIYASTYSLFSIRSLKLHLKPLVGNSAVSGTVVRTSWNPTSNPTQTSWSALGARKHADTTPGREGRFILTARDLKGPKDGWYRTNTKGEPMLSFAGSLEIHTFGETRSTYQNGQFKGGLFLAELEIVWAFKDYAQQPGLMNLIKGDNTGNSTISTDQDGKLILTTPSNTTLARAARTTTASEIIWMVTDAVVQTAASAFPAPFGWLIKGGWWFLKWIAGGPSRSGGEQFVIYASINDARANVPCLASSNIGPVNIGQLHFQQIAPGNTGIGDDLPSSRAISYEPGLTGTPTRCVTISAMRLKENITDDYVPAYNTWYFDGNVQNNANGLGFIVGGTRVATYNCFKVSVMSDVGPVTLQDFEHKIPIHLLLGNTSNIQIGYAVAGSYVHMDTSTSVRVSSLLVCATHSDQYNYNKSWRTTKVDYPVTHTGNNFSAVVKAATQERSHTVRVKMVAGEWYLLQFVTHGIFSTQYKVGSVVIATRANDTLPSTDTYFTPTEAQVRSGLVPSYMAGSELSVFTTSDISVDNGSSIRQIHDDLDPSFGCDDSFEFPPPPPGCENSEDEFEDPEEAEETDGNFFDSEEDEDENLELGPDDDYSDPPISRLVVNPDAQQVYEQLRARFPEREARLAANQLIPSGEYTQFTEMYHNALVDGLSPREARAFALGL